MMSTFLPAIENTRKAKTNRTYTGTSVFYIMECDWRFCFTFRVIYLLRRNSTRF